ncbi:MAG: hypothetical protein E2O88_07585 [Bacteroidetes bacterium]|nr:MAG: hypothetical protein E2O88_07585 [Bacteroidota bacterium]
MFVTFDTLSDEAKIWIYQAERELTSDEQQLILDMGKDFMDQWGSHGQPLTASIEVIKGYFVVISVDGYLQMPSGCSIDESVAFIRRLGEQLKVNFFDRTKVPLWINGSVQVVPLMELKQDIKDGKVHEDTQLFNTLIQKKSGLSNWVVSLKNSWLGGYLPQTQADRTD